MNTNNNNGNDLKYDDLYDETIGFFSDPFIKKEEIKKTNIDSAVNKTENVNHFEEKRAEVIDDAFVNSDSKIINQPVEEECVATTINNQKQTEILNEAFIDEGTCNAFTYTRPDASLSVEPQSIEQCEEKKINNEPIEQSDNKGKELEASKCFDGKIEPQKTVEGIGYAFFTEEKIKVSEENQKQQKKYKILCIVCVTLFFLIIPLFLLPIFVIKYIQTKKKSNFNVSISYNTLKWNKHKDAEKYEVYSRIENSDRFKLFLIEQQTKCILPRGKNGYIVVAKKADTIVAVSELFEVSL